MTREELVDAMQRVVARHTDDIDTTLDPDIDLDWLPQLGTVLFWIAVGLIAAGTIYGLVTWARRARQQNEPQARGATETADEGLAGDDRTDSLATISAMIDRGAVSDVPSMLYRHLVTHLTSTGVVQRGEYKTHRTLLRALSGRKKVSPVVERVGSTAEHITFGHGETSREECVELRDAVGSLTGEPHAE